MGEKACGSIKRHKDMDLGKDGGIVGLYCGIGSHKRERDRL